MDATQVLERLQAKAKPSVAKTYRRHGVFEPCFGVSYADLAALVKTLGVDHALARQLWASGNHDARVLATKLADPGEMDAGELETWVLAAGNSLITDALAGLAARMLAAKPLALAWIDDPGEWVSSAGWGVLSLLAFEGRLRAPEASSLLARVRRGIGAAPNRTRHAMNMALIAIGGAIDGLRDEALKVAREVSPVRVNHGHTGCATPDAEPYILRMAARARPARHTGPKKAAKKASKRGAKKARKPAAKKAPKPARGR